MAGFIVKMACPSMIKLSGLLGVDVVVIDTEHGPGDAFLLEHHFLAVAAVDFPVLVGVPVNESGPIQSAPDLGTRGVIVPHVSDSAGAQRVVRFSHYPPLGARGLTRGFADVGSWWVWSPITPSCRSWRAPPR